MAGHGLHTADSADAYPQDATGAAGAAAASGGGAGAAAAGPSSAAPDDAAGAAPGLLARAHLPAGPAGSAATTVESWNCSQCGTLAHEAEALTLFNRAIERTLAASELERLPALARATHLAGCGRVGSEAMGLILRLRAMAPDWERIEAEALGLRQVEDDLVPLARADPPLRLVEQVLELWLQEVTVWTGAGSAACGSVFAERPALENAVFDVGMRYSVRDAPLEALRTFRKAMGAMLEDRSESCALSSSHSAGVCAHNSPYGGTSRLRPSSRLHTPLAKR